MTLFSPIVVASLGSWLIVSSLWIYPHSLSYFNESIGGPLNGPEHLLGSNVDWGQDLRYAIWLLESGTEVESSKVTLAYAGFFDPTFVGLDRTYPLSRDELASISREKLLSLSSVCDGTSVMLGRPTLISLNLLFGAKQPVRDGSFGQQRLPEKRDPGSRPLPLRSVRRVGLSMVLLK